MRNMCTKMPLGGTCAAYIYRSVFDHMTNLPTQFKGTLIKFEGRRQYMHHAWRFRNAYIIFVRKSFLNSDLHDIGPLKDFLFRERNFVLKLK